MGHLTRVDRLSFYSLEQFANSEIRTNITLWRATAPVTGVHPTSTFPKNAKQASSSTRGPISM